MELNQKIYEWLFPASLEPDVEFDGTPETLPRSFGDMGVPDYTTDPAAMLELLNAVSGKGIAIQISYYAAHWNVGLWLSQKAYCEVQRADVLEISTALPAAVAQAVSALIDAETTTEAKDARHKSR